ILIAEYSNPDTLGPLAFPHKLLVSFFHSVTPRTAGFNSIDVSRMMISTVLFSIFLTFIGGASGSTAGGVKVNTFGMLMGIVWSSLKGKKHPGVFGREFTIENISQGITLITIYLTVAIIAIFTLSITEGFGFLNLVFEVFSALGTVGLTTGITPNLSIAGEVIIIVVMFIGRLGPLTLALSLRQRWQPVEYRYPEDIVRIG
ncbi:MAG: Trk family potassium uptake protein, partial [Chloroflexi bacterium]|nr:Trk family potassium uptake protein [Chloroflexota bacterium]